MASTCSALSANLRTPPNSSFARSPPWIPLTSRFFAVNPAFSSLRLNSSSSGYRCRRAKASMAEIITPKSKGKVKVFDAEEDLAVSIAEYAADLANKISKERDSFTVVFSGGSLLKSLRWSKLAFFFYSNLLDRTFISFSCLQTELDFTSIRHKHSQEI